MYVRKFEADTLDGALKNIKRELGPDAIILKTVTNKGFKGAFKKKKIEITAAISEKNYTKKAKVDNVLDDQQKEEFYSDRSSSISKMIDGYSSNGGIRTGYGNIGLNRKVSSTKNSENGRSSSLDDFLNSASEIDQVLESQDFSVPVKEELETSIITEEEYLRPEPVHMEQNLRIDELEKKLFEMSRKMEELSDHGPDGVYQLRVTLRSLDIREGYIQRLIEKSLFELSREEQDSSETVFEFALREMMAEIKTGMPLFSSVDSKKTPVITALVSETSTGQSSMVMKIGALKEDVVLVQFLNQARPGKSTSTFAEKMFDLEIVRTTNIAETVSAIRSAVDAGKSVFVDYSSSAFEQGETRKFIEGLKRSFDKVEVLLSLSAIHSEMYNRKMVSTYKSLVDGLVVSHLDLCLNFGALFNIAEETRELPFKFYGTGEVIPDDIEAATAERMLAGIFQL